MILYFFIFISSFLLTQENWYNHPELNWKEIETEHFVICFHQGTERSAAEVANVAEAVFTKVTNMYNFIPDGKTTIIVEDVDDYSNGGAYFFDNKIVISGKPMDYDLRGAHRWLQDVITHEYVHIVQLGASMKYSRHIPGSYIQILDYEGEKRQDVLYGYPNKIVSYPIPNTTVPPWFAEGTAQYMFADANYDYWDSIRDMILRDRILNDNLLTYNEMNTFGKKGIGNESIYNQGFSLVRYIVKEFGEEALYSITKSISNPFTYSIDKAINNTIGISGDDIYNNWKDELNLIYSKQLMNRGDNIHYELLEIEGTSNIHPVWSPNGNKFAFLSNKSNDYFGQTSLYVYSFKDSSSQKIKSGIKSAPTWIDDNHIIYSKKSKPNKNGSKFFDLYSYDIEEEEEERLTEDLRLFSPVYDKNNQKIYAINTYDGSCNILMGNKDFSLFQQITDFNNGLQIFSLSIKDSLLLFDAVENHGRNIYYYNLNNNEIGLYDSKKWDVRDLSYSNGIEISSNDKFGVFNLYLKSDNENGYITNVSGGAFMPDVSENRDILFSLYEDGGYKIALLKTNTFFPENNIGINRNNTRSDFSDNQYKDLDYYNRPSSNLINTGLSLEPRNYEINMTGPFIMPRIMYDYNTIKPGLYLFDNDLLNKMTVLAGASFNSKDDIDIFMLFEHNRYKLSYFFNFYFVTRNVSRTFPYINSSGQEIPSIKFDIDYTYHLFSTDIGSKFIFKDHKFWLKYTFSKYRQFYNVTKTQTTEDLNDYTTGDGAHNYYSGHIITLDYEFDGRKPSYLGSMLPSNGFIVKSSISYENNNIFEEFRVNENLGAISEYLAPHNTARIQIDASKHWTLFKNKKYITLTNNIKYMDLTNKGVDDFLYFFGGGLPGIKGYTFYEPTLQGPNMFILTNDMSIPIFTEKAIKMGFVYLNSASISFVHQMGKASSGKIIVYSGAYNIPDNLTLSESQENYLLGLNSQQDNSVCYGSPDAMDVNNCIPNELEPYIFPDIYSEYNGWNNPEMINGEHMSIKDLKDRYRDYKQSVGFKLKLYGFSFYSYPTALTYECHIPVSDSWNSDTRHYLKVLFDFD